jgi:TonB-dependent SusC/RagA subfamily outer membrane receptor
MRKSLLLPALLLLSAALFAQNRSNWDKPMELQRCSISIKADLFTATTFIEMVFYNPNDAVIEGLQRFQLQPGQAITAFQLDLGGKLRDGTIEEKWKAQNAYNTIVGKRIDPALLQMDSYNNYSLRIFPIEPKGTRRITFTIQQGLAVNKQQLKYHLPCLSKATLKQFAVEAQVASASGNVQTEAGVLQTLSFNAVADGHRLQFFAPDYLWDKPIAFSIPLPQQNTVCMSEEKGEAFFAIRYTHRVSKNVLLQPKSLAVYWDISASGNNRDVEKEISFLKQYLSFCKIESLAIIPFHHKTEKAVFFQSPVTDAKWLRFLRSLIYDGGTRLGELDFNSIPADAIFLMSDGYNSIGAVAPKPGVVPVFSVHAGGLVDNTMLDKIIGQSGGKNIDLQKTSISAAVEMAGHIENKLLNVRSASGKTLIDMEKHDEAKGQSFLNGKMTQEYDTLFFEYGTHNNIIGRDLIVLDRKSACNSAALGRLPALLQFDEQLQSNNWQQLLLFGKEEGIVTYRSSYIVLERIEDYVRFNIKPPKELEEACEQMQPGFMVRINNSSEKVKQSNAMTQLQGLSGVVQQYNQRLTKLGEANPLVFTPDHLSVGATTNLSNTTAAGTPGAAAENKERAVLSGSSAGLDEVVVVGYANMRRRDVTGSITSVRADDIFSSATSVEQALAGRVAGVQITQASPFNNDVSNIRIRGASSLSGNSAPLFVLDGIPLSADVNGGFNINDYVQVSDIQWITVLKDASAAAIYGSRGANGVIVIETKKGRRSYRSYPAGPYRLKDMEDMEYLQEIKAVPLREKKEKYQALKGQHEADAAFYLDVAQHFFEAGLVADAKTIITNAAEKFPGDLSMQRTLAFYFEQWGEWGEAIRIYEQLLAASPKNILLYRNAAQALLQGRQYQKAAELLYKGVSLVDEENNYWTTHSKELLLNELNALAAIHAGKMDLSFLPKEFLRPAPVDLRIVIEGSNQSFYGATIIEPDGELCTEWAPASKSKGFFTQNYSGLKEYQIKNAEKGRYRIRVNYYDNRNGNHTAQPGIIRLTVYKNFGRTTQSVWTETLMMDNQNGIVEIGEVQL